MRKVLNARGFITSKVGPLIYVDAKIYFSPDQSNIETIITDLKRDYDIMYDGGGNSFLGFKADKHYDSTMNLS